jgi:hypothetical protein
MHMGDNNLEDTRVTCMLVHPVSYPNHGAVIEKSLASEALGLIRSLDWEIAKGPRHEMNEVTEEDEVEAEVQEIES